MYKNLINQSANYADNPEYRDHNFLALIKDEETGLDCYVAVHRKNPGIPSFGATRLCAYASDENALSDALRLSRLMSYKAALAGLPCGGAKAVIILNDKVKENKEAVLKSYAENLSHLKGCFVTGTDVGLSQNDIEHMREDTDNLVGFNDNATDATADGLVASIKVCLEEKFGTNDMKDRSFAIQGLGKVGEALLSIIHDSAGQIFVSDINKALLEEIVIEYPDVIVVSTDEIHKQNVDVFSPCALSHSFNGQTVKELHCSIIAGAANNQLENHDVGNQIHSKGILYAPDYVVNAGGLIAVYDEYENGIDHDVDITEKIQNIGTRLKNIISESNEQNIPTYLIANRQAEVIFNKYE
jgi:leucine dehydrogenase